MDATERMMPEYKGYAIEVIEVSPLQWFSTIQRLDGKKMKSPVTDEPVTIWECPNAEDSAEAAVEEAKAMIDAGIQVAGG